MSTPTKLILALYGVAIVGYLILLLIVKLGAEIGFILILLVLHFGPPVFVLVLAYAVVRALRDLLRQPDLRTPVNITVAIVGLISLVAGGWFWYLVMSTPLGGSLP